MAAGRQAWREWQGVPILLIIMSLLAEFSDHYPARGAVPCGVVCALLRSNLCVCSLVNSMEAAAEGEVPAEEPRALFAHGAAALGGRGAASAARVSRAWRAAAGPHGVVRAALGSEDADERVRGCKAVATAAAAARVGARAAHRAARSRRAACVVWCAHGMETAAEGPAEAVLCAVVAHAGAALGAVSYTHLTLPTKRIV